MAPNSPASAGRPTWIAVVVVDDDVDRPDEIEGDDEQPKQRTYPDREKRQHGQHPGCEVAVGGEGGEAGRQIGADDAGRMKTSPKKRKLCSVAMARCASTRSIDLSQGQTYAPKQSSHAT